MFPIIKIRLKYVKRNIIKNLLSLSYPIIIIYLFIVMLNNLDKIDLTEEANLSFLKRNLKSFIERNLKYQNISNEPRKHKSKSFDLFDNREIQDITFGDVGIISENEDLLNTFHYFALENFCFNNDNDELNHYTDFLKELIKSLNITMKQKRSLPNLSLKCNVKTFKSKKEFNKYINSVEYKNETEFKVVFEIKKDEKNIISFGVMSQDIKINSIDKSKNLLMIDTTTEKNDIFNLIKSLTKNENAYKNYYSIISNFLKLYTGGDKININEKVKIFYKPLNTPPADNKLSSEFISTFIPMIISISFSSTLFAFVLWMVKEKSQNLHQFLFSYGVSPKKYYESWFNTFIILTIIPIIICSYMIFKNVFVNINFIYILFSFILFDISLFTTSLLVHTLTKTTEQSQSLLKLIYLFITFLSALITKPEVSYFTKKIFSFFPQIILIQNFQELIMLDNFKTKHFYIDYELLKTPYNKVSLLDTFITYFIVIILHLFIANIIISYQNFYSSDKNINNKCLNNNFILFLKSLCKSLNLFKFNFGYINLEETENSFIKDSQKDIKLTEEKEDYNDGMKIYHEPLNSHQLECLKTKNCLNISNITKSFTDVIAVNNFNGNLFPSEIFCLLGHNGAGKTTLIKIISGEEKPDNGDILLFGNSILKNKKLLYRNIGVCNQDNNFFDYLTIYEHLKYLSEIKQNVYFLNNEGITEIKNLIEQLGLEEKKNSLSKTLSGGQKRKLCIALALAGNSKLILLDEPTSGLDVLAKRELWNFFKNYKNDKILILTTHSLEEAENLGDRIGIMLDGKFVCSGTGSFLKNKYPCGYNINFLMKNKYTNRSELLDELKNIDDSAIIKITSKNLLSINFLSLNENKINLIFEKIEKSQFQEQYGIINYTISTTSLEDVFLKLNNDEISDLMLNNKLLKNNNELIDVSSTNILNNTSNANSFNVIVSESNNNTNSNINDNMNYNYSCGIKRFFIELCGGVKRNLIPLWRNKCNFVVEVLSASITIIIYLLGLNTLFSVENMKNVELMELYNGLPIYYSSNFENKDKNDIFNIYEKNNIIFQKYPFIKIKEIDYPKDLEKYNIEQMCDYFYNISNYKNERNFLVVKKNEESNSLDIYVLYQTISIDYFPASLNYILSILFQQKYGIKSFFISEVNNIPLGSKPDEFKDFGQFLKIFYSIIMLWNSFISLSGYMINTPLKERVKNIKHLLKLSGASMFIYWLSLLIVDLIKYFIFIITVLPLLVYIDKVYLYNAILIFPFLLSLNMLVYCYSFIIDSEIHSQKIFLLSVYALSFGLPLISIIKNSGNIVKELFVDDKFIYSISDIFPFSSYLIAMFRLFYNSLIKKVGFFFENKKLSLIIYNNCILFLIQFVFYSFLLFLFEIRFFERIYIFISNLLCFRRTYSNDIDYNNNNNSINNNRSNQNINNSNSIILIISD